MSEQLERVRGESAKQADAHRSQVDSLQGEMGLLSNQLSEAVQEGEKFRKEAETRAEEVRVPPLALVLPLYCNNL